MNSQIAYHCFSPTGRSCDTKGFKIKMAAKGMAAIAIGASAGALATVAGYYMAGKIKELFGRKPKMKLFNNQLLLSTRCTWFISGEYDRFVYMFVIIKSIYCRSYVDCLVFDLLFVYEHFSDIIICAGSHQIAIILDTSIQSILST